MAGSVLLALGCSPTTSAAGEDAAAGASDTGAGLDAAVDVAAPDAADTAGGASDLNGPEATGDAAAADAPDSAVADAPTTDVPATDAPASDAAPDDTPPADVPAGDAGTGDGSDALPIACLDDGDCKVPAQKCIDSVCTTLLCQPGDYLCDPKSETGVLLCDDTGMKPTADSQCPKGTICGKFDGVHACDGLCGKQAPSGCWCDSECATNGDCCWYVAAKPDASKPVFNCGGSTCGDCNDGILNMPVCNDKVCAPSSITCQGNKVATCNAAGTALLSEVDCGSKKCVAGVCKVCEGSMVTCSGNTLKTCAADGQSFLADKPCGSSEFCSDIGNGNASCKPQVCVPNEKSCAANAAQQCNGTGSGYLSAPSECTKGKCLSGVCKNFVCAASAASCTGQSLVTCAADGFSVASTTPCGASEFCSDSGDGKASCKPQICVPNEKTCAGNAEQQCNATGSGYSKGPTACTNGQCVAGSCKAFACTASAVTCAGQSLQTCSADGFTVASTTPCGSGKYCSANGSGPATCLDQICTPNEKTCVANAAQTCNADGSAYLAAPAECTGGKCVAGVCKPFVCKASAITCDGQKLKVCAGDGLSVLSSAACPSDQYCSDSGDDLATCMPQVCTPATAYCDGTIASMCDAYGAGPMPNAADCSSQGLNCVAGQCQLCGNAVVEGGEGCDDGNSDDADGCSNACVLSPGALAVGADFATGAYAKVATSALLKLSTLTISAWIRPTALPTGSAIATILAKGDATTKEYSMCLLADGVLQFGPYGGAAVVKSPAGTLVAGSWQQVLVTWDGATAKLYVNGKLVATASGSLALANSPLFLGAGPDGANPLGGTLSEVGIYPSVLSASAIAGLALGQPLAAAGAAAGCWPMREGAGGTAYDASGNFLAATLSGVTWSTANTGTVAGSPNVQLCTPGVASCLGKYAGLCNGKGTGLAAATNCALDNGKVCSFGSCLSSYASCKAALKANPAAADGDYSIDPDGAGPTASVTAYCDMAGGGWTLLSVGGACNGASATSTIGTASACAYLPATFVQALAAIQSEVKLNSGGNFGSWTATAKATNNKAIEALQSGGNWHNGATFDGGWDWTVVCTPTGATSWPSMYHSCNTPGGVHWNDHYPLKAIFQVRAYNNPVKSATWLR